MRALLFLLPALFTSCGTLVTQNQIFEQTRAELALREPWSEEAIILVQQQPDDWRVTWRVSAGYFDRSESPSARGIRVVPGTERELCFTRDGCLLRYENATSRCLRPRVPNTATYEAATPPDK